MLVMVTQNCERTFATDLYPKMVRMVKNVLCIFCHNKNKAWAIDLQTLAIIKITQNV
jgi:hypothetical protein